MDLDKVFQSPLHLKVVSFFYENPTSLDTASAIATWVNHRPEDVEEVLEELVNLNILIAHRSQLVTGFAYTQDKEILTKINNHFKSKTDKES